MNGVLNDAKRTKVTNGNPIRWQSDRMVIRSDVNPFRWPFGWIDIRLGWMCLCMMALNFSLLHFKIREVSLPFRSLIERSFDRIAIRSARYSQ
ncbi:hypothetical protein HanRHA438_Chr13g0591521 [Helianthus annuus]|nr:hypothetical protein HanRHA438_Chr13g0591521 [Helianthus annuus]